MYPEPARFNPDRFMDAAKNAKFGINEPPLSAFGFGRRICPGRFMAYESMWIAVASVLATFEVSKAKDADGNELTPNEEYTDEFLLV